MNCVTRTTSNHEETRTWVEQRGGRPATLRGTRRGHDAADLLRFDFPGRSGQDALERISWEEWFAMFDAEGLRLLHQTDPAHGADRTFFEVIAPD